jgi:hypothetical protein
MKTVLTLLVGLLVIFVKPLFAQDESEPKKDTIIKATGEKIVCVIKTLENDKVQYITGGRFLTTTYTQRLSRINFSDGSHQFYQPILNITENDWQSVKIVSDRSRVKNLVEKGIVNAERQGSVFSKQQKMQSEALDQIKKEAAKLGSHIVLIVDASNTSGTLEMQGENIVGIRTGAKITAIAYGF